MLSFKSFLRSFRHAGQGLLQVFNEEQSFRIQVFVALLVLFLIFYLKLALWKAVALILVISFVLVLELINSIFERMADIIKPGIHEYIKSIKDIMAGAVLVASLAAIIIGVLIFYPYLSL